MMDKGEIFPDRNSVVDDGNSTVLICDRTGTVIDVLQDDLGLIPEGESPRLESLIDRDSHAKLRNFLTEIELQGLANNWEMTFLRDDGIEILSTSGLGDGDRIWLAAAEKPAETEWNLREFTGELEGWLSTSDPLSAGGSRSQEDRFSIQEITRMNNELVSLQREVQQQKSQLELLNQEKDRFLGLAAHDLRNPLAAIMSYAEFLLDELELVLDREHRDFLESIQASSRYMLSLIDDLLDVSLISLGGLEIDQRRVSLADLVAEVVHLNQILAARKEIDLKANQPPDDPLQAWLDPTRIRQVLNNLLSNAVKFCPPGSRVMVESARKGDEIEVIVRDNGPGIPRDELEGLFEMYRRTSVTSPAGEKSTGLGLAIAHDIIKMHDGEIAVESEPGKGTIFTILLPGFQQELRINGLD